MSADAVVNRSSPLPQTPPPDAHSAGGASLARALLAHPSRAVALLWASGAVAVISVLPLRHWSSSSLIAMIVAVSIALAFAAMRITIGSRLPRSSLQVDVGLGNLLVSVVVAADTSEHISLANLYFLVAFFAFLYLPLRSALAHTTAAGAAYAAVLGLDPTPVEPRVIAWLAVFGTVAVLGAVIIALVSVLRVAAREDPLTGLANRRTWDERFEEEIKRSRRSGEKLSVVVVDLDDFKTVNDANGHDVGDRLLRDLAGVWQTIVRDGGDFLARFGGDEFVLLAPHADETGVRRLVKRLTDTLPDGISASFGTATWDGTENASDLLRRADRAMYQAKRRRRRGNGFHFA